MEQFEAAVEPQTFSQKMSAIVWEILEQHIAHDSPLRKEDGQTPQLKIDVDEENAQQPYVGAQTWLRVLEVYDNDVDYKLIKSCKNTISNKVDDMSEDK
ncbi:hypothetical protein PC129_g23427 [Phytophthora cactorum]|uniref:Uncharacterized protein n=1 Tax=Phytophthora cactorum TaxID=29920 RepID=A0A329RMW6_9STRA|nr:hypothetical protein Pcac1_g13732 [Phytophthora cactorum]KAG2791332.1 hypothetical protein PC111_g23973 [Phytophthora cactorum]KAG2793603.1 hypothetical protein PC112_g23376 [Phytophthora cactorum]KAG2814331.1 hypothetical protein PC113_g23330 [Phytophthora cactorum]KAG2873005.1 hypothetical protein PC114_g26069 [Phytophthora cactorum]